MARKQKQKVVLVPVQSGSGIFKDIANTVSRGVKSLRKSKASAGTAPGSCPARSHGCAARYAVIPCTYAS